MSRLVQLVEELQERLSTVADTEHTLVSTLRDALARFDQKLLQDVRDITAEHESRRNLILHELQGLATRMGAFPGARRAAQFGPSPSTPEVRPSLPANGNGNGRRPPAEGGAWRQAADRLQDELDSYFRRRGAPH